MSTARSSIARNRPVEGPATRTVSGHGQRTARFDSGADAEEQVRAWAAGLSAKAERYREMSERVAQVVAEGSTPDGGVRVRVGTAGELLDLELTARAYDREPRQLAADVLAVVRAAQGRLAGRVSDVVAATVSDHDPATASAVVDSYRQRFGDPSEPAWQSEPAGPPARRRPDDGDEGGGSVLRPV